MKKLLLFVFLSFCFLGLSASTDPIKTTPATASITELVSILDDLTVVEEIPNYECALFTVVCDCGIIREFQNCAGPGCPWGDAHQVSEQANDICIGLCGDSF